MSVSKPLGDGFVYFNDANVKRSQPPIEAVIVPAAHGARFYEAHGHTATTYWTPQVKHVFLMNNARDRVELKESAISERIIEYRYQVVGIVEGRRLIFVNAFCRAKDWMRKPVAVDDGGACYFTFKYEPETGEMLQLSVNGDG